MIDKKVVYMGFNSIEEEIIYREKRLLDPGVRKSREELDKLLPNEFIEYCTSGYVCNKYETLENLPNNEVVEIIPRNFVVRNLADDVILVNFETFNKATGATSMRSSIWKLIDGTWQMFFHQGTREKINEL